MKARATIALFIASAVAGSFIFFDDIADVSGASLTQVRDLLSTSAPSATSTHTINFTATNAIPQSGKIIITPAEGFFNIPPLFDYTDIDFAVSTTGPSNFIDRSLVAIPSVLEEGVAVISGTSGSIEITLNSSEGIAPGSLLRVKLGDNTLFGEIGDQIIYNPAVTGSYKIGIMAQNGVGTVIDSAFAMVAIIQQISIGPITVINYPPERSNGLPSGVLASGNQKIEISLNTNEPSTCKYSTVPDIVYASMTSSFSTTGVSTLHTAVLSGFQNGSSYTYYVRCIDLYGADNTDDYVIAFSIKSVPPVGAGYSVGGGGVGAGVGVGNIIGGSQELFLSSVLLEGRAIPSRTLTFLKDGEVFGTSNTDSLGNFSKNISGLERGAHTFAIYAVDSKQRKSASHSSTLFVRQGTVNRISEIFIAPTIELLNNAVDVGDKVTVFGESIPDSTVEVLVYLQGLEPGVNKISKFIASSTASGQWELFFDTLSFEIGTYTVKARSIMSGQQESNFSRVLFLGVGEEPSPDFSLRADLNHDGKVNLVDFSILIFHWHTSDDNADINSDGDVGLADFSIMLFYWTG
jgi:hypothetical protein